VVARNNNQQIDHFDRELRIGGTIWERDAVVYPTTPHMQASGAMQKRNYSALAMLGCVVAVGALGVALWAALSTPTTVHIYSSIVTYEQLMYWLIVPGVAGLVAVFLGSQALHRIDRYADQLMGEGMAILTITLGWLAVIISAVASFASLGWPILSR